MATTAANFIPNLPAWQLVAEAELRHKRYLKAFKQSWFASEHSRRYQRANVIMLAHERWFNRLADYLWSEVSCIEADSIMDQLEQAGVGGMMPRKLWTDSYRKQVSDEMFRRGMATIAAELPTLV